MKQVAELIKLRRSVRTYDGWSIDETIKQQLLEYAENIQNPFGLPVEFRILDAKKHGLTCPVVSGTDLYIGGKIKNVENASMAFGYSFEKFGLLRLL